MRKTVLLLVLVLLVALIAAIPALGARPGHSVHVGGPDVCAAFGLPPGCDANHSLVAIEHADGSVTGQWTDQFGFGNGGFHAVIDCLEVDGSEAWVSGWITHETISGDGSLVGEPVSGRMRDNGTSANDPADQISFSHIGEDGGDHPHGTCDEQPDYEQLDMPQGQVKVR